MVISASIFYFFFPKNNFPTPFLHVIMSVQLKNFMFYASSPPASIFISHPNFSIFLINTPLAVICPLLSATKAHGETQEKEESRACERNHLNGGGEQNRGLDIQGLHGVVSFQAIFFLIFGILAQRNHLNGGGEQNMGLDNQASRPVFLLISIILFRASAPHLVSSFQFEVGEEGGWKIPNDEEPETYNEWATQNRFQIDFKYQNASVLVVSSADYLNCNTANPIPKFEDGSSVFQFDRSGFFYFMSGQPGHCKSGQRLIIRVMHLSEIGVLSPTPAPVDGADGGVGIIRIGGLLLE